jgi:hypothetical protein
MQIDKDIGKISQSAPVIICIYLFIFCIYFLYLARLLELFLKDLILAAATHIEEKGSNTFPPALL